MSGTHTASVKAEARVRRDSWRSSRHEPGIFSICYGCEMHQQRRNGVGKFVESDFERACDGTQ